MTALTLEEYPTIDLRLLRRQGFLAPGAEGTLRWFLGPRPIGSTPFAMGQRDLTLVYRLREAGSGKRHELVQAVGVLRIPQPFGGERVLLVCPGCGRRCALLYGDFLFRCRLCVGATHRSQHENAAKRQLRRAQAIRVRLGATENLAEPFPERPKGMHWNTYMRLLREYYA